MGVHVILVNAVVFNRELLDRFIDEVKGRFPRKTFGYFLSSERFGPPEEYVILEENVRNDWLEDFHAYGNYYVDHDDAGFLATPEETWRMEKYIRDHNLYKVGVFHSHQRHPAILTSVDADFHPSPDLWHLLIVLRNMDYPQARTFAVLPGSRVQELDLIVQPEGESACI
jgi:proteasome lid subunit RPN8/RPN11